MKSSVLHLRTIPTLRCPHVRGSGVRNGHQWTPAERGDKEQSAHAQTLSYASQPPSLIKPPRAMEWHEISPQPTHSAGLANDESRGGDGAGIGRDACGPGVVSPLHAQDSSQALSDCLASSLFSVVVLAFISYRERRIVWALSQLLSLCPAVLLSLL